MPAKRSLGVFAALLLASGCGGEDPPPEQSIGAPGVRLSKVALYQGPEHVLALDNEASTSSVPLMAGRGALLRVFYETTDDYDGFPVTTRLSFAGNAFETTQTLYETSLPGAFLSTVNFTLAAEQVVAGDYAVELTQLGDPQDANSAARYPASGQAALPPMMTARNLRVVLVPYRYDFDGSMRLPDTSDEQLTRMRQQLHTLFPLAAADISVHEVVPYAEEMGLNNLNALATFLDAVLQLRSDEAPDDDVYYHGMILPAPAATADDTALAAGLAAMVDTPEDPTLRASVSLGVSGDGAATTFVHELGHLLGRRHSPCGGASGPDLNYPHAGAGLGVLGFDLGEQRLVQIGDNYDLMGYCGPKFISDYTYARVAEQVDAVVTAAQADRAAGPDSSSLGGVWYERISVHADGSQHRLSPIRRRDANDTTHVTLVLVDGTTVDTLGSMSSFDHASGGILVVPQQRRDIASVISITR